jgi:hypothetical protein
MFINGQWSSPQYISQPRGPIAPKLTTDSTGTPWIVTLTDAPTLWPLATEAWAIRWGGNGWEAPIRLSDPILPLFTLQYQLSVSDEPGTNPVAIWVSRYAFSVTRADLLCSKWTGEVWTPPELVGSLADSSLVTWPDVARYGGSILAAYNRGVGSRPFVQNVFTIQSAQPGSFADGVTFSARTTQSGVMLSWSTEAKGDLSSFRIRRERSGAGAPPGSTIVAEFGGQRARSGSFFDRTVPGPGHYSYWIDFVLSSEETVSVGPRGVEVGMRARAWGVTGAIPDSRTGTVVFRGSFGLERSQRLMVFDIAGRMIRRMDMDGVRPAGEGQFEVRWDGLTQAGSRAPSGVYFVRIAGPEAGLRDAVRFVLMR